MATASCVCYQLNMQCLRINNGPVGRFTKEHYNCAGQGRCKRIVYVQTVVETQLCSHKLNVCAVNELDMVLLQVAMMRATMLQRRDAVLLKSRAFQSILAKPKVVTDDCSSICLRMIHHFHMNYHRNTEKNTLKNDYSFISISRKENRNSPRH